MKNLLVLPLLALLFAGCVNAHIDYGRSGVAPVRTSRFSSATVSVGRIVDLRFANRKTVSYQARKKGAYNKGVAFSPAEQIDYREVFAGIAYDPEASYYIAPDRLYWTPDGPLTELRVRLARHLWEAGVFRAASAADNASADYALVLTAHRFLALKGRHPLADGIGFLGVSALYSSDEIYSVVFDWQLVDSKSKAIVASGRVDCRNSENHNNFRAKDKPFKIANAAACRLGNEIAAALARQ